MRITDIINQTAKKITIFLTAVMISVVGVNVFCRYVLGFSMGWGEELPRYCLVWITFVGGTVAVKNSQLMAIGFLVEKFPYSLQNGFKKFGYGCNILFLGVAGYFGLLLTLKTYNQASPALRIPMSFIYVIIPIGCAVMILHTLDHLFFLTKNSVLDRKDI